MKTTIKKRIEEINSGIVPEGYEKTSFGIFPCDWERDIKFGELFDFYGGLGKSREELGDQGVCYLHYGDMHTNTFNKVTYEQYSRLPRYDIALNGNETFLMQDGDIAFLDASEDLEGTSRAVLIDNVGNKPFIAGLHTILAKEKQSVFSKYYKQYITISQDVKKQFQKLAVGFKVYGLNRESIKKIKISYPKSDRKSDSEQSRIAEILMQWDKAIELQEKLIEAYQKSKKYYLKKMFPKKGSNIPEIRFPGFTAPWEQRKVGELLEERDVKAPKSLEYPLMAFIANEGVAPKGDRYDRSALVNDTENKPYKQTELGDFIYSSNNLETGSIGLNKYGKASISPVYSIFYSTGLADSDFLGRRFVRKDFINEMVKWRQGVIYGQWRIHESDFVKIEVAVPCVEEQRKIGRLLDNIDNLITLHQQKRDKLLKQRQAMQQYLLTGIVRV